MSKVWAKAVLNSNAVILDTETTGVYKDSQVIQLCVIDMQGNVLLDSLFRPTVEISSTAIATHHITKYHLRNAPMFTAMIDEVKGVLSGRTVIAYNISFDKRMLSQTLQAFNLDSAWFDKLDWQCAMRAYAEYLGVRNSPKLEGGDHSAKGDCLATLRVIREMARIDDAPVQVEPPKVCEIVATRPAPPPDMIDHMIKYLNRRIATLEPGKKGPGSDWLPWLVDMDKALKEADTVRIEILSKADLQSFLNIDSLEW